MQVSKPLNLPLLQEQLVAQGVNVPALGLDGTNLHTYDANGAAAELPIGAVAVVNAHDGTAPSKAEADTATLRQAVQSQVGPLVGVKFTDMTALQRQTLIAGLAYKLGILDKSLAVRPLQEWL